MTFAITMVIICAINSVLTILHGTTYDMYGWIIATAGFIYYALERSKNV